MTVSQDFLLQALSNALWTGIGLIGAILAVLLGFLWRNMVYRIHAEKLVLEQRVAALEIEVKTLRKVRHELIEEVGTLRGALEIGLSSLIGDNHLINDLTNNLINERRGR
ncbi:MAG: hypothetical protein GY703_16690 [Gammaproteobacteria bacterium]|nr:hypothetical protein [Gammaproteobacteria bacterium]